jgi:23S rRNA pseudouridine1911/1915/1917 synthase
MVLRKWIAFAYLCTMPRNKKYIHRIRKVPIDVTIEDYCAKAFPLLASRTAARRAIAEKRILLNGRPIHSNTTLKEGGLLELKPKVITRPNSFDLDLERVFEDDYLIVVNKPGGIAVNGHRNKTVENALSGKVQLSDEPDALPQALAAHRIDVPTKGLVLLAKTKSALISMNRAFQNQDIHKAYVAVVHGQVEEEGTIDKPIGDKPACTHYESLRIVPSRQFGHLTLLRLLPETGRTHQLRIHLQGIGHPVLGDNQYTSDKPTLQGKGLFLCAYELEFQHPVTSEEIKLSIPVPNRFRRIIEREAQRF